MSLKYAVSLNQFSKFGPSRMNRLIKYFSSLEAAFKASFNELVAAGIESQVAEEFLGLRPTINPDELMNKLEKEKVKVLTLEDNTYPKLLKEIYQPPFILYYRGRIEANNEFSLAVVGTRKYTNYGKQVTQSIVKDLARNNLTIISGLAHGIDTLAHTACLEATGNTVAVLGSGLDRENIYPANNRYLIDKIILSGGCVLSEFPLGTPPLKYHFPQRNRIISGLSLGTLVIEAGEKSGALITAQHALEQNREIFAIPGSVYSPVSVGPNKLIKLGAKLIASAEDIVEALNLTQVASFIESKKIIPESEEEKTIISYLSHEPIHIDELVRLTSLNTSAINSTLTIMEMKGMVRNLGGMQYVLAR